MIVRTAGAGISAGSWVNVAASVGAGATDAVAMIAGGRVAGDVSGARAQAEISK
jgi:hypothetical protein